MALSLGGNDLIRILMSGCNGKMGQVITKLCSTDPNLKIIAGVTKDPKKITNPYPAYSSFEEVKEVADVVIDFSSPDILPSLLKYCHDHRCALVLATTGFSEKDNEVIRQASEVIPVFKTANMSIGINVLIDLVTRACTSLGGFDIELIEKHHNEKKDAPSGTALMIAKEINNALDDSMEFVYDRTDRDIKRASNEIGISVVRGGTIPGEHTILFAGKDEILEVKHSALSRDIFAVGALKAAKYIITKKNGMFDMKSMLKEMN